VLTTIIATAIVLGILVFVHELGHFLLAKKLGVTILKFSLGFGPKLIGKKIGETEYQIAAFPLGGFVKPLGEDPSEELGRRPPCPLGTADLERSLIIGWVFNFFLPQPYFSINFLHSFIRPDDSEPGRPAEMAGRKGGRRPL
jgi:regulator of sigma E protease